MTTTTRPPIAAPAQPAIPTAPAPRRTAAVLAGLAGLLAGAFVLSIAVGSVWIPPGEVIATLTGGTPSTPAWTTVVLDIRLPRALTAVAAGAALGTAGLQMQTLFRNPLADPFVLGISAGASLGVAVVVLAGGAAAVEVFAGRQSALGDMSIAIAAILGAFAVLGLVLLVSARLANPSTVLVVGLMAGYAISAVVTVLVAQADGPQLQRWVAWGFGSFSGVTWARLGILLPATAVGLAVALLSTKQLNALLLGERYAQSMGLAVRRARIVTMVGASVLGGVVTAFCGPIAFLGIAVPHLCRALLGSSDHQALVPAVVVMGGVVALLAQVAALMPWRDGILPLNAVTALLGAPVVAWVLLRSRRGVFTG